MFDTKDKLFPSLPKISVKKVGIICFVVGVPKTFDSTSYSFFLDPFLVMF